MKILPLSLLIIMENYQITSNYKREQLFFSMWAIWPDFHRSADLERLLLPRALYFSNPKLLHTPKENQWLRNILTFFDEMVLSLMKNLLLHDRFAIAGELRAERDFFFFLLLSCTSVSLLCCG